MNLNVNVIVNLPARYAHSHFELTLKTDAAPLVAILEKIQERLNIMPTNAELTAKLQEIEDALTQEIQEITDALKAAGVSQENLDKLDSLKSRISGIVNP